MSDARDWLATLWPGSYKGVQFFFEKEEAEFGRDAVVHEFPHRDDPFVEDMGATARYHDGDIYVHGDDADAASVRLEEIFSTPGPGVLVVPMRGPVSVHALKGKRVYDKDKLGFVALKVRFVRAGAPTALISVPLLGNLVVVAGGGLVATLASTFASTLALAGQPNYVVAAASDGAAQAAAALDVARQSWSVDPAVSAQVRDAVVALVDAAPVMIARTPPSADDVQSLAVSLAKLVDDPASDGPTLFAQGLTATARVLAAGMPPVVAQSAMADFVDAFAPSAPARVLSLNAAVEAANAAAAARLARLAGLVAWSDAVALRTFASRPEGVAARAEAGDRFEVELNDASGAENAALFVAIEELRGRTIEYLSRLIADLAPVVEVSGNLRMPSLYWAWRLYADPMRAGELVARNHVRHPSFMPTTFSALAPR